jgi:membrane protease YdiL (CAAX protease family)
MVTKPDYRTINLLFLLVLLLQISNMFLLWLPQYVRLILNQLLFVFLPAYLYLRITRQPIRERVRWTWPSWKIAALSMLIGMALYPLSAVSSSLLQQLLGYVNFALPADALPESVLMGILAIVAYAVMAPLCEEFLFRGVIQPVYEQRSPLWGVFFTGGLFVVFHLSLLQGISIIPLALALGFVNYRTRSLPASILTHFGANALAALVLTDAVFPIGVPELLFSAPVLITSPIVALTALVIFTRLTQGIDASASTPQPAQQPLKRSASWPLLVAATLYLAVVGAEFFSARSPAWLASPLHLQTAVWEGAQQSRFEIRNPADNVVGEGECLWQRVGELIDLDCTSTVIAYEVRIGNSYWSSAGGERRDHFRWQAGNGRLISGQTVMNLQEGAYRADIQWTTDLDGILIQIEVQGEPEQIFNLPWSETPLAENDALPLLTDYAAPWQLTAVNLEPGMPGQTVRFHPFVWRQDTQDNGPTTMPWLVTVVGRETIHTPAGTFDAWKVSFGNHHTVWLDDRVTPAQPVRFFNGTETWSLK